LANWIGCPKELVRHRLTEEGYLVRRIDVMI
jgi:hypothetical protein